MTPDVTPTHLPRVAAWPALISAAALPPRRPLSVGPFPVLGEGLGLGGGYGGRLGALVEW